MIKNKQPWQQQLSQSLISIESLCQQLSLIPSQIGANSSAHQQFPLRVTPSYLKKIEKGNPNDPLLLQILPHFKETLTVAGYSTDPLAEAQCNPVPGLLHKYRSRVLLVTTSACAIHCRYCFRRHFPYQDNAPKQKDWAKAFDYIAAHPEIEEVILSGGDPLTLNDNHLESLVSALSAIKSVKLLRIHSRIPVILPERMTDSLLKILTKSRLKAILVTHINHPRELDTETGQVMERLKLANFTLLNQSVLLKNINDNVETLVNLSKKLFKQGILPYYIHLLDKVAGSAHFDLDISLAKQLIRSCQQQLPGYLVPQLVCEQPGAPSKTKINTIEENSHECD